MRRHKDYKEDNFIPNMGNKRGQLAIFFIIAIVIVGIILVVFLYPRIKTNVSGEFSPYAYLESCISPSIKSNMNILANQGGYANPEGFILYNNTKVKYLCYIDGYYQTCLIQQPMIAQHFETELNKAVAPKARDCFNSLKKEYENKGYTVSSSSFNSDVQLTPGEIKINFIAPTTVTKDSSQTYKEFTITEKSQMYDILFISASIVEYEATYGDSETTLYLQYYPNIKVEKVKLSDGSKIYTVSNVVTNEHFTFATRSLAWPPGYGVQ